MDKSKLIPGRKYLHRRKVVIAGRTMEAERWIQCMKITSTGALFRHEFEMMELTDQEIKKELIE